LELENEAYQDNILFGDGDAPVDEPMPAEPSSGGGGGGSGSSDDVACTGVMSRGDVLRQRLEAADIIVIID
jgi:hypothetical protein